MHLKVSKKEYCIKIEIKIVPPTVIYLQCLFVAKLCLLNRIHLVIFLRGSPFLMISWNILVCLSLR